jgi:hypothetical protein
MESVLRPIFVESLGMARRCHSEAPRLLHERTCPDILLPIQLALVDNHASLFPPDCCRPIAFAAV